MLTMKESTYDSCLLYNHQSFDIVEMQTDDILLLATDDFANKKKKAVKSAKILTRDRNCLISINPIKFNDMKIQLHLGIDINNFPYITFFHETHVDGIVLIQKNEISFINNRGLVRKNLSTKNQHVAQRARSAYFASIYQSEAFFDLSYAVQSIEYISDDISQLNKRLT